METLDTALVITLDRTSRILLWATDIARDIEAVNVDFWLNFASVIINKPYFWGPVDAANMTPTLSLSLFDSVLNNNTLEIIAEVATYISWMSLGKLLNILATLTEPIFIWETLWINEFTLVASLMNTWIALIAYNDLISYELFWPGSSFRVSSLIFIAKAYVANDIFINIIWSFIHDRLKIVLMRGIVDICLILDSLSFFFKNIFDGQKFALELRFLCNIGWRLRLSAVLRNLITAFLRFYELSSMNSCLNNCNRGFRSSCTSL